MIWDRKRDRIQEAFVANIWAKKAGVQYQVTPNEERYDIKFFDAEGTKVLAEVKVRSEYYPTWFVEDRKSSILLKRSRDMGCTPWYLIYCKENRIAYKLNLHDRFKYEEGTMYGEWGKFVPVDEWLAIAPNQSVNRRMTTMMWK